MKITEEMVQALSYLRTVWEGDGNAKEAFNVLDNADIFRPIDEHTDYDINPDPAPMAAWNALVYWHLPGEEENNRGRAYLVHARTEDGAIGAADAAFHQDGSDPARLGGRRSPIIDGIKVSEARKDPAEWGDTTGYAAAPDPVVRKPIADAAGVPAVLAKAGVPAAEWDRDRVDTTVTHSGVMITGYTRRTISVAILGRADMPEEIRQGERDAIVQQARAALDAAGYEVTVNTHGHLIVRAADDC